MGNNKSNVSSFLGVLLSRREWVYLLSLLIPLFAYNLALRALDITWQPEDHELIQTLELVQSAIFFNLGYVLLWIGLFAAVRREPLRWAVVFFFHVAAILIVVVNTVAHQYLWQNGTSLDYPTVAEWISKFDEIEPSLFHDIPLLGRVILAATLFYVTLGPSLLTRIVGWLRGWPKRPRAGRVEVSFLRSLGLWLLPLGLLFLAFGFGSLSVLTGTTALAKDPFVNVLVTGIEEASTGTEVEEAITEEDDPDTEQWAAHVGFTQASQAEKRNVVLVHLESTRARSVTPYNEDLNTTPFLNELARSSLLVERAYVGSVSRSSLSNISVNCGIQPPNLVGPEYEPGRIPARCLPTLLKEQGYNTVFFSSNVDDFGSIATKNLGYEEVFVPPGESAPTEYWDVTMDTERFAWTSHFGYEDDIMLEPSENWLKEHKDEPFIAEYLTGTGHEDYRCLGTRYGSEDFSENDLLNSYLNCLRLQDIFLKNLFDQYKELGLYEETIFVLFGDHGEGLGEHGRFLHGDTIWEEGLRIPLIIHAPGWFEGGEQAEGLSNFTDVLPTVLEMLGYEVKDGKYPGYSLLHPLPEDRTLMFSCISRRECLASIKGNEKYIYHYDNRPEEVYDLSEDPLEKHNLADEYSREDLDKRREDLFAWLSRISAEYGDSGNDQLGGNTGQQTRQSGGQPVESTVAVGQPLTVGDVEWTVTSAYTTDQLISSVDGGTKRGNFVVVDFQLKNNSNEGLTLSSDSLTLFDGNGRKFEFDTDTFRYIDRFRNIFLVEVDPGISQEGQIIFKVSPDVSQFRLQLGEANPFSNKSGYVNLGF